MASLWMQNKGATKPKKLIGGLSLDTATRQFEMTVKKYVAEKPGRKAHVSGMDALLFDSKGRMLGNLFIEPLSPPSQPGPGEKHREAA